MSEETPETVIELARAKWPAATYIMLDSPSLCWNAKGGMHVYPEHSEYEINVWIDQARGPVFRATAPTLAELAAKIKEM